MKKNKACDECESENQNQSSSRIWVHDFGEANAQRFTDQVLSIAESDHNQVISVYIDSYGGYVDGLTAMISVMDSVSNHFVTICTGKAMSAAAVLLAHGDTRCIGPHGRVMIHEAQGGTGGNVNDVHVDAEELRRINNQMLEILAQDTGQSVKNLRTLFSAQRDIYLNPQQALKYGLVDHIGIPVILRKYGYDLHFPQKPQAPSQKPQKPRRPKKAKNTKAKKRGKK